MQRLGKMCMFKQPCQTSRTYSSFHTEHTPCSHLLHLMVTTHHLHAHFLTGHPHRWRFLPGRVLLPEPSACGTMWFLCCPSEALRFLPGSLGHSDSVHMCNFNCLTSVYMVLVMQQVQTHLTNLKPISIFVPVKLLLGQS